jgi:hypothetical protein
MLSKSWNEIDLSEFTIDENIIQSLFVDFSLKEEHAIDLYFQSETYRNLIDPSTAFYQKSWNEIYQILLTELGLKLKHPRT